MNCPLPLGVDALLFKTEVDVSALQEEDTVWVDGERRAHRKLQHGRLDLVLVVGVGEDGHDGALSRPQRLHLDDGAVGAVSLEGGHLALAADVPRNLQPVQRVELLVVLVVASDAERLRILAGREVGPETEDLETGKRTNVDQVFGRDRSV